MTKIADPSKIKLVILNLLACNAVANAPVATADQKFTANLVLCDVTTLKKGVSKEIGLKSCEAAIALKPQDGGGYLARGSAFARSRRYELAMLDFQKATELGIVDDPDLYTGRGFSRSNLGDEAGAIVDFVKAHKAWRDSGKTPPLELFAMQANVHPKLGQFDDAWAIIAAGRDISKRHAGLSRIEALVAFEENKPEQALAAIQESLEIDPRTAVSYVLRGLIYGRLGKVEFMLRDFQNGYRINKELPGIVRDIKKVKALLAITKEGLRVLGHDPGGDKDHALTAKARAAMRAFQKHAGLAVDGKFNDPSLTAVIKAAGKEDLGKRQPQQDPLEVIKRLLQAPGASAGGAT